MERKSELMAPLRSRPVATCSRRKFVLSVPALGMAGYVAGRCPGLPGYETDTREATWTAESEKGVRQALAWLRKSQNRDGGCGIDIGQVSDIGTTATVGLALMAYGATPLEGPFGSMLKRIHRYILQQTENMPANDITSATGTQLQNKIGRHAHSFFAALFLSQVVGMGQNPTPVHNSLKRVISAIVRAQSSRGDWGADSWAPVLGTVMGWVSLRAADSAGVAVGGAPGKTGDHLIKVMRNSLQKHQGWMHTLYKNATGIRVLYEMQLENDEIAKQAWKDVLQLVKRDNTPFTQAGGEEFLAFHLITETMLKKGGDDWNEWFPTVRDKLINVQGSDGSWTGHHCITSRTFCTAAAVLVLTSPYRFLPISQA